MTAALLFAATFAAVFTLGIQQINVERRHMLAAAATSPLIGLAHLVLFKVLPGPTDALEIAAYLAGGSAGIVAGIWAYPHLLTLLGARRPAPEVAPAPPADATSAPPSLVDQLGETLRLATAIADDHARTDIESYCTVERQGWNTWYDTSSPIALHGPDAAETIATALRYLQLRGRVVTHPAKAHLVRFEK